jgi:hypothetical protein
VTRGIVIMAASALACVVWSKLFAVRGDTKAQPEMLDLAIGRAQRSLIANQLAFYACAAAAPLGVVGNTIRTYLGKPSAMSPVAGLTVLAIFALGLFLYGRRTRVNLAKFRHLIRTLAGNGA